MDSTHVTGTITVRTVPTGESVTVGGVDRTSGTTSNDFTDPITYTVSTVNRWPRYAVRTQRSHLYAYAVRDGDYQNLYV